MSQRFLIEKIIIFLHFKQFLNQIKDCQNENFIAKSVTYLIARNTTKFAIGQKNHPTK